MRALLIATYEMGRQPFGLASPAAWLRRAGWEIECADVSRNPLTTEALGQADWIGFYLPMHTATRLALQLLPRVKQAAPGTRLCAFGLYAPIHGDTLRAAGIDAVLGPEFESELVDFARAHSPAQPATVLPRLRFAVPDRSGLPSLDQYACLEMPDGTARVSGYTEASRGCKHRCRHCPIVPVYNGQFRIVDAATVAADIRQQVECGAEHISFGDPDFLNGPRHALRVIEALHAEHPRLSFDVTIKVEHLLRHAALLPRLRECGCVLITTAVESFDDTVLAKLDKGHTEQDFLEALALTRRLGLALNPTFVAFTPWTTPRSFAHWGETIAALDLIEQVAPVQYGIRLLIPAGSRLLELGDAADWLGPYDPSGLSYEWRFNDPASEELCRRVQAVVAAGSRAKLSRRQIFADVFRRTAPDPAPQRATIPYLNEPWFC
ncbi:MAG TPA: CUAEP/CCAEP-tail radical SAM protein [Terriglobales bacterium]|nr:CUAEP/CCAEP-tail radical SAM protein [Terriglobales bacterium]